VQPLLGRDLANAAFPFLSCAEVDLGFSKAVLARLSLTGELGYEIYVPAPAQPALCDALMQHGRGLGLRHIGNRALDSLRLEKSFGIWSTEFTQSITPGMCGLDRHVAFDKADFIGRDGVLRERDAPSSRVLVTLAIDAAPGKTQDADPSGFEPVKLDGRLVGYTTSGAYGHWVRQSLALAYVDREVVADPPPLTVDVVGEAHPACILERPAWDARGERMRG